MKSAKREISVNRKLQAVPLSSVEAKGWLRTYLLKQVHGLTGNAAASGFPFDSKGWGYRRFTYPDGNAWWGLFEQTGYWVDGAIRCGHLIRDAKLIKQAAKQILYVLEHPNRNGYIGPHSLREPGKMNQWVHAVFFRALTAYCDIFPREKIRVVRAMRRHYLSGITNYSFRREVCNIESILWCYEQCGDRKLLRLAVKAYEKYNRDSRQMDTSVSTMASNKKISEHGVTTNEIGKIAAIMYSYTGKKRYLNACLNMYRKIDRDQMLISGVHSSTEGLKGKTSLDSHETCDIADFTWSCGHLLMITGDTQFADKIERACFNAAPGAVKNDFRALQYFSCPNQTLATANSNHNKFFHGQNWMAYQPQPRVECCAGNVHRIMPNYGSRMWMTDTKGGLYAALYGPSRVKFQAGRTEICIAEETRYPFSEEIAFVIRCKKSARFHLHLRIPGWCKKASIRINDEKSGIRCVAGSFARISRTFCNNDRITLRLPMKLKVSRWPRGGTGIELGPIVFSLRIKESWRINPKGKQNMKGFPTWDVRPASPWNYALCINAGNLQDCIEIRYHSPTSDPWDPENPPITLRVPARRVKGWRTLKPKHSTGVVGDEFDKDGDTELRRKAHKGNFEFTPPLPHPRELASQLGTKVETVTLVPYGCTHLRISVFPRCSI